MYQINDGPRSPGSKVDVASEFTNPCGTRAITSLSVLNDTSEVSAEVGNLLVSVILFIFPSSLTLLNKLTDHRKMSGQRYQEKQSINR